MAVVVKMWHYIWHDLLNALLRFQRVSRSRPLREGKHALALYEKLENEILGHLFIRNYAPTVEGRLRRLDLGKNLGARPFLGVVIIGGMPVLLELDERFLYGLQMPDAGSGGVRVLFRLEFGTGILHFSMIKGSGKRCALPNNLPL